MQPKTETRSTLIFNSPCFLKAWLSDDNRQLTVYRSTLVQDSDLPTMIKRLLANTHRVLASQVVEDHNMMFGEGILSVYRISYN